MLRCAHDVCCLLWMSAGCSQVKLLCLLAVVRYGWIVSKSRDTQKIGVDAYMSSLPLTSSAYPFATIRARTALPCPRTHLDLMILLHCSAVRLLKETSV